MYSNSNNLEAKFTVVFLDVKQENLKNYIDFLYKKNINFVNCQFNPDEIVLGESHPNALNHKIVAQCLSKNLKLNWETLIRVYIISRQDRETFDQNIDSVHHTKI